MIVIGIFKYLNLNGNNILIIRGFIYDLFYIFISVLNVYIIIDFGFRINNFVYLCRDIIWESLLESCV